MFGSQKFVVFKPCPCPVLFVNEDAQMAIDSLNFWVLSFVLKNFKVGPMPIPSMLVPQGFSPTGDLVVLPPVRLSEDRQPVGRSKRLGSLEVT